MYAPGKLELVFVEIICTNTSNLIIGCIYNHPLLHIGEFISPLFYKFSKESSKQIFFIGWL